MRKRVSDKNDVHIVDTNRYHCTCTKFESMKICPHLVGILDSCGKLEQFLRQYSFSTNNALNAKRPIKQGDNPNKKRRRGRNNCHSKPLELVAAPEMEIQEDMDEIDLSKNRCLFQTNSSQ